MENRKTFGSFLRLLISWTLLPVAYGIVYFIGMLGVKFVLWVLGEIAILSFLARLAIIIIGGSFFLAVIFYPLIYGATLTVAASEGIYCSKNGTRYIVFATVLLTLTVLSFILTWIAGTINIASIYVALYCILLIAFRQKRPAEEERKQTKPATNHSSYEEEAFRIVSRYAARKGMGVREYCICNFEAMLMSSGEEAATAKQRAQARAAEQVDTQALVYGLILELASKTNMTVPQYINYCREQEKNMSGT